MNIPANLGLYQSIYNYIKAIPNSSYTVIGNPGNPFIFPLSPDQVLSTADQLVIFEGPNTAPDSNSAGFDSYPYGPDWFQNPAYPSSRFANIIYGASEGSLQSDFSKAAEPERRLDLHHRRYWRQSLRPPSLVLGPGGWLASQSYPGTIEPGRGGRLRDRR